MTAVVVTVDPSQLQPVQWTLTAAQVQSVLDQDGTVASLKTQLATTQQQAAAAAAAASAAQQQAATAAAATANAQQALAALQKSIAADKATLKAVAADLDQLDGAN